MKRNIVRIDAFCDGVRDAFQKAGAGARYGVEAVRAQADRMSEVAWSYIRDMAGESRHQVVMLGIALAIMVPSGLSMLATSPAAVPAGPSLEEKLSQATTADGVVASAWKARALERERASAIERFARNYSISDDLAGKIYSAARKHDIEPAVAFGLVRAESSFRRTAVSHAGAVGYTQLLPSTAGWIAPGTTRAALFNTETNLDVGFKYLRYLTDKYDGNVDLALTAYNRGQGAVDRMLRQGRNPDNGYAAAVRTGVVSQKLIRQNSPRG